jgi:hypothetical protein
MHIFCKKTINSELVLGIHLQLYIEQLLNV